jgi:predicted membrane protein
VIIDISEPAVFKPRKKQWMLGLFVVIVAAVLLFIIREQSFGFGELLFLAVILLIALPILMDSRPRLVISRDGIWLYKDINIAWKNVILTYIEAVHGERLSYSFVVHFYSEEKDHFDKIERELENLVSPGELASAIEQFRQSTGKG